MPPLGTIDTKPSVQEQIETTVQALIDIWTSAPADPDDDSGATGSPYALVPTPKRVIGMNPGETVTWDDCCAGQLSFRLVSLTPKYASPDGRRTLRTPCSVSWWDAEIEVQLLRCMPSFNNAGKTPSAAAISTAGQAMLSDMQNLLSGLRTQTPIYAVSTWTPVGPQGGCTGGSWSFTMRCDAQPC